jgi:hypothetical protein
MQNTSAAEQLMIKGLKNIGFREERVIGEIWYRKDDCRVVIDCGSVSIYKFANFKNGIVEWMVRDMDANSVPFLAIYAVIDEAVRS